MAGKCNSQNKSLAPMSMSTWALGFPSVRNDFNSMIKIFDEMLPSRLAAAEPRQLSPLLDIKETKDEFVSTTETFDIIFS